MHMPFIEAVFKFRETVVASTIHLLKNGPEKEFIILISNLSFLFFSYMKVTSLTFLTVNRSLTIRDNTD